MITTVLLAIQIHFRVRGTGKVERGTPCLKPLGVNLSEEWVLWEVALNVGQVAYLRAVALIEGMLQFSLSVSF